MQISKFSPIFVLLFSRTILPLCFAGEVWKNPCDSTPSAIYCNEELSFEERVADLVGGLTVDEMIGE